MTHPSRLSRSPALAGAVLASIASACTVGTDPPPAPGDRRVVDDAVGVAIDVPEGWRVSKDPVLFDTHGFFLHTETAEHGDAAARIALAYQATPAQLDELAATKLAQYADAGATREDLVLADGRAAIAITGLPGTQPYSVVFTSDGDRVYEIGLWSAGAPDAIESPAGIDERGRMLLDKLRPREPTVAIDALGLPRHDQAIFGAPPPEFADASAQAAAIRAGFAARAAAADPYFAAARTTEVLEPPTRDLSAAAGCGFTAPGSLYWQLQWDATNTFYSGSWYDLRARSGWSAMSGNFGSWWGTNFHVGLCYAGRLNQYYANDWPAQYWANAYAAFSGYVEWAGWGTDGFASLGRYVVVRNGQYRSLTAHLIAIADGIEWGAWIDGYSTVIGWAGDTGEYYAGADWAPHLHARVAWGESLTWNGQPYGGQSVAPDSYRCFDCNDYDVGAAGAGGYYTRFWHGRWMRY